MNRCAQGEGLVNKIESLTGLDIDGDGKVGRYTKANNCNAHTCSSEADTTSAISA